MATICRWNEGYSYKVAELFEGSDGLIWFDGEDGCPVEDVSHWSEIEPPEETEGKGD